MTAENGHNNFTENGSYTVTITAEGFKSFGCSFTVNDADETASQDDDDYGITAYSDYGIDTLSSASFSGGGSSSGDDSSSLAVSANIVFDGDLLANALILDETGLANDDSAAVIERWAAISGIDSAYDKGDAKRCTWIGYINAVESLKASAGRVLSFAEYKEGTPSYDPNGIAAFKEVLEDGLLGETQNGSEMQAKDYSALTVTRASELDGNVVLTGTDADYIAKIAGITINGNYTTIDPEKWSIDTEAKTLTIDKSLFTAGNEYSIAIGASGYKTQTIKLTYAKNVETGLSLTVDYPDGKSVFTADEEITSGSQTVKVASASFTVKGSSGDFLKNLSYDNSVMLGDKKVWTYGVSSRDDVYYSLSSDNTQIILHNVPAGEYELKLTAQYYSESLTADFKVAEPESGEDKGETTEGIAVEITSVATGNDFFGGDYFQLHYSIEDKTEALGYIGKISSITVNGTEYEAVRSSFSFGSGKWYAVEGSDGGASGIKDIRLSASAFTEEKNTVTIAAEGYAEVTVVIDKDGNIVDDESSKGDSGETSEGTAVEFISLSKKSSWNGSYYLLTFSVDGQTEDIDSAIANYCGKISSVTVNGTSYSFVSSSFLANSDNWYTNPYGGAYGYANEIMLTVNSGFNTDGNNTIVIEAEGYAELSVVVDKDGKLVSEVDETALTTLEADELTEVAETAEDTAAAEDGSAEADENSASSEQDGEAAADTSSNDENAADADAGSDGTGSADSDAASESTGTDDKTSSGDIDADETDADAESRTDDDTANSDNADNAAEAGDRIADDDTITADKEPADKTDTVASDDTAADSGESSESSAKTGSVSSDNAAANDVSASSDSSVSENATASDESDNSSESSSSSGAALKETALHASSPVQSDDSSDDE